MAPGCDPGKRRFESDRPPHLKAASKTGMRVPYKHQIQGSTPWLPTTSERDEPVALASLIRTPRGVQLLGAPPLLRSDTNEATVRAYRPPAEPSGTFTVLWSSGYDASLSRRRAGFDSLWDRHFKPVGLGPHALCTAVSRVRFLSLAPLQASEVDEADMPGFQPGEAGSTPAGRSTPMRGTTNRQVAGL
jgi:hypothetical protein